ncbi:acyloxyacyl hydrolase [Vibrio agarivorans]|uniref:acyloxyacyl hydrolase n=1 Tax=Vibrio agarivorans TaxID=153622 RepID=UPI00222F9F8F|nr:acyloxyacyl hydrolase [Vibrio agarivorans]
MYTTHLKQLTLLSVLLCASYHSNSTQLAVGFGGGPQFGTDDSNLASFFDVTFFNYSRSEHQMLSLGTSVTHATTNSDQGPSTFTAISIFPELKLFSTLWGKDVFFQVRALGPSYLSHHSFGSREQAMRFAFQAQVGGGIYLDPAQKYELRLQYRHFSNANLKQPNDGIDFPLMVSLGYRF